MMDEGKLEQNTNEMLIDRPEGASGKDKIALSDAITAYINFVLSTSSFPYEKSIDIGFLLNNVYDDTGILRYKVVNIAGTDYLYSVTRKTWSYMVVKIFQYPKSDETYWVPIGGLYKFSKTLITLGTDRILNAIVCTFDALEPISIADGRSFIPYATSIPKRKGVFSLLFSCALPIYLDPVDIYDSTWKDFKEAKAEKVRIEQEVLPDPTENIVI